jgi:protein-tyrosine sulfotransferase
MSLVRNLSKYLGYGFEAKSFAFDSTSSQPEVIALEAARRVRGPARGAALILHGILPGSGTVYAGELLRLHPDLHAYPYEVWEFPFLQLTGDLRRIQEGFLRIYEQNIGKVGAQDFLPLFGASVLAYLYEGVPEGQRVLLKVPSVQYEFL